MIALTVNASPNARKKTSYSSKRVSLGSFFVPPPKLLRGLWLMSGTLRSYICCFRFLICCIPDFTLMECSNEVEIQSGPVLPDGIGRFVRDTLHRSMIISRPPLNPRSSTGSCCIVRIVLNGGSVPGDVACAFPVPSSSSFWLIPSNRQRPRQLDLESVWKNIPKSRSTSKPFLNRDKQLRG